jgi:hypothetical protein
VLPGKTGSVKATFNAAAAGPFNKPVTVFSNTEGGSITLYLNGEVVPKAAGSQACFKIVNIDMISEMAVLPGQPFFCFNVDQ